MNSCENNMPVGINKDCTSYPARISNIVITKPSDKFKSLADFNSLSKWKEMIKVADGFYVPVGLSNSEDTTEDPKVNTTALGDKVVIGLSKPSATINLKSNPCDFNEIIAKLHGGSYGIYIILEDGTLVGWLNSDGEVRPFKASLYSTPFKIHDVNNPENAFKVWINYLSLDEHKKRIFSSVAWNPNIDLVEAMPNGLSLKKTSTVTAGAFDVFVSSRCGSGVAGLVAADFKILEASNEDFEIASVVDNTKGFYTVTVDDGGTPTPTPLSTDDYVNIRIEKEISSLLSDISSTIQVVG